MSFSQKKYQTLSVAKAHGKFGELLQGALPGKNNLFLISMPINTYSIAKFCCNDSGESTITYPAQKFKSVSLVFKIMEYFNLTCSWELCLESQLSEGKGLGSSTADLVATARAVVMATKKVLPMAVFLSFLREIEPSDGIMYDGLVCFYHRKVQLHSQFNFIPNFTIVGVDESGMIDTLCFNRDLRPYGVRQKKNYNLLLEKMQIAIQKQDIKTIGEISTQSAILHQDINPKKNLHFFLEISDAINAVGIIVAHSGTYIGIILDKNSQNYFEQLAFVEKKIEERSLHFEKFDTFVNDNLKSEIDNV